MFPLRTKVLDAFVLDSLSISPHRNLEHLI